MDKRARIVVTGRVQKAGFRELVDETAFGLDLKGFVKNREDGSVEVVAEGPEERLEELTRKIDIRRYPVRVDGLEMELSGPTGEFREFEIIKDERLDGDFNGKLNLGIMHMRELSTKQDVSLSKQDAMLEKQDTMIQKQDETLAAVRTVDSDIKEMDSNMAGHFERLDEKYGEFGDTMKGMASDIRAIRTDAASNRKRADPV